MTAPLTLYGMNSPNVRKVGILLEELELAYDLVHVGVTNSEQFTPEFLGMNPFAKVPVLVDPALGRPLFESGAILFYLAERHGRFLPGSGADRYEAMEWMIAQMALMGPMFGQLNHFRILPPGTEPYAEARYAAQSERLYRILDDRLAAREWIAGDAYSIADIAIHPWSTYLEPHGFSAEDHPALVAWRTRIFARPALQRQAARFKDAFTQASAAGRARATSRDVDAFFGRTEDMPQADYSALLEMKG